MRNITILMIIVLIASVFSVQASFLPLNKFIKANTDTCGEGEFLCVNICCKLGQGCRHQKGAVWCSN